MKHLSTIIIGVIIVVTLLLWMITFQVNFHEVAVVKKFGKLETIDGRSKKAAGFIGNLLRMDGNARQIGSSGCSRLRIRSDAAQLPRQRVCGSAWLVQGSGRIHTFPECTGELGEIQKTNDSVFVEIPCPI